MQGKEVLSLEWKFYELFECRVISYMAINSDPKWNDSSYPNGLMLDTEAIRLKNGFVPTMNYEPFLVLSVTTEPVNNVQAGQAAPV